ncbi:glycosyltransferase family 4 protein [Alkalimarinus coralli]|uniref:glycosyltransferase family 4 protein n=1 Tax=Alkalimarinus coralli TaxID=2935863 RepID=UPI00202B6F09|nr:glycosyltransferase family 4 protein [Alkalimarinus coralli]
MDTKNQKFKMLFISKDKYPTFRVDVADLFGDKMVSKGHEIDWLLQSGNDCRSAYSTRWSGGDVWVGRTNNGTTRLARVKKHCFGILNDLRLFSLANKERYDFIQVKDKFISALIGLVASKIYGTRFFFWLSFPYPEEALLNVKEGTARYPVYSYIQGQVLKFVLYHMIGRYADHIFVQSEKMKSDVAEEGVPLEKLTAVPMGVSVENVSVTPATEDCLVDKSRFAIVYLGTLNKTRKLEFVVSVFAKVRDVLPHSMLYFVGDGDDPSDRKLLEFEAARLGVSNDVVFTGFLPREQALAYVKESDVCLSPFFPTPILNSTSPTKLIEYMAMGAAVVANDHPEQRLVIAESGGGICVPYDENKFSEAIVYLLNNPDTAQEMGRNARQYVLEKRSYNVIADKLEETYLNLCHTP